MSKAWNMSMQERLLPFSKLESSGRDFVLLADGTLADLLLAGGDECWRHHGARLAEELCHRGRGIGADGLLLIGFAAAPAAYRLVTLRPASRPASRMPAPAQPTGERPAGERPAGALADPAVDINGVFCAARFCSQQDLAAARHSIATDLGPVEACVAADVIRLTWHSPTHALPGGHALREIDICGTARIVYSGTLHRPCWLAAPEQKARQHG
ncbi:MAG TPA: hypothetical protein VF194_16225 [Ferrovibrio sp.]|uniref:hypothetical protein n=1 Tax=Ferrovibrio sp. TaxID=1917215 RepID=UPI002ED55060